MKKSKSIKASRAVDAAITYVILIAVAVFFFFPCLWLIFASFSDSGSLYTLKGFSPKRSASAIIKICSPIRRCITTPNGSGTPSLWRS